jgi:hypothetical protein
MATATTDIIQKLKFMLLPHPAHSPDTVPSDFHIFGPLNDALRGHQFANDTEVKDMASQTTENILHRWHQKAYRPNYQLCGETI